MIFLAANWQNNLPVRAITETAMEILHALYANEAEIAQFVLAPVGIMLTYGGVGLMFGRRGWIQQRPRPGLVQWCESMLARNPHLASLLGFT